jgi:hypothetical protein
MTRRRKEESQRVEAAADEVVLAGIMKGKGRKCCCNGWKCCCNDTRKHERQDEVKGKCQMKVKELKENEKYFTSLLVGCGNPAAHCRSTEDAQKKEIGIRFGELRERGVGGRGGR